MSVTTKKSEPKVYKLTDTEKVIYDRKHKYLAPELQSVYGLKTDASDMYSFGFIFNFLSKRFENFQKNLISQMLYKFPEGLADINQVKY